MSGSSKIVKETSCLVSLPTHIPFLYGSLDVYLKVICASDKHN
jgi:hypothetical protein